MPIYEFHCPNCNTIYSFRSRTIDTVKCPACPHCGTDTMTRSVSHFAVVSSLRSDDSTAGDDPPIDEVRMERALSTLEGDLDKIDEKNPRALAEFMRKFSRATGLEYGEKMEDALRRLERGEDPDAVETSMGDLEDDENPFDFIREKKSVLHRRPPRRDDTLYDM